MVYPPTEMPSARMIVCELCSEMREHDGSVMEWCEPCRDEAEARACEDCGAFPHEECSWNCSSNWSV